MKRSFLFTGVIISLVFIGCPEESPLPAEDAGKIKPKITVARVDMEKFNPAYYYKAVLEDSLGNYLKIESGGISVNGLDLPMVRAVVNNAPYYYLENPPNLPFKKNELYTFTIELNDGERYTAGVTTQSALMTELILPATHSPDSALTFTWNEVDSAADAELDITLRYKDDEGNNRTSFDEFDIENNGYYTISSDYLKLVPNAYEIEIELKIVKTGSIDDSFMNGSRIEAINIVEKSCTLE